MLPLNSNLEIVKMYEDLDMTLDQITEETGYEKECIVRVLIGHSAQFRATFGKGPKGTAPENKIEDLISPDEDAEFIDVMKSLARGSDNDVVRLRAAQYLHDEYKGRNNKVDSKGTTMNIVMLNEGILKAREQIAKVRAKGQSMIDVGSTNETQSG